MDLKDTMLQRLTMGCILFLHLFDDQCLSNLASGYVHMECVPTFEDGRTLFDCIAPCNLKSLAAFTSQGVPSISWLFAKVEISNTQLLSRVADCVLKSNKTSRFNPPELANYMWALGDANKLAVKAKN